MSASLIGHLASTPNALPAVGPGSAVIIGVVLGLVAALVAVVVLRERYHRRRRKLLELQLGALDRVLMSLSSHSSIDPPQEAHAPTTEPASPGPVEELRGPLSTVISGIRRDIGTDLPSPDRIDLKATLYLYEHVDRPIAPADLADGLNLSLRSVQRGLSGSLGCTPRELILAIKMREAKRMLTDDECRVQEAARAVGFDDPFHFSRRFKTDYGLSPTEMQDRISRGVA
jgi:AraC-like DNA-binding protein